mmetsp:Transcript_8532/g.24388  ORF Transcript_8532/g.24388 Transcript_8532/m.24388 type:complete len:265 (-) Transcript_8532:1119-1913(-)
MHVLVDHSVNQEQLSPYPGSIEDHRTVVDIALLVLLVEPHVPLRVVRVVPVPRRDRSSRHRCLEHFRGLRQSHRTHVAAIAPAINSNPLWICQPSLLEPLHPTNLVVDLEVSHLVLNRPLKVQAAPRASPVVELEHKVPLRPEKLGPHVNCKDPALRHHLNVRPAIHAQQSFVRPGTVNLRVGAVNRAVEHGPILRRNRDQLWGLGRQPLQAVVRGQDLALVDDADHLSVPQAAKVDLRRVVWRVMDVHKVAEGGVQHDVVHSG